MTSEFNNNIDNKIDIDILSVLNINIKDINIEPTIGRANNNINIEIDTNIFISKAISKIDKKFIMDRLHKANMIIKKKYINLICFNYY